MAGACVFSADAERLWFYQLNALENHGTFRAGEFDFLFGFVVSDGDGEGRYF